MKNRKKLAWNKTGILLAALVCLVVPAQAQKGIKVTKAVEAAVTRKVPGVKPPKLPKTPTVPTVKVPHVSTAPVIPAVPTVTPHLPPAVSAVPAAALVAPVQTSQAIPQFELLNWRFDNIIGLEDAIREFATTHNRIKNGASLRHDFRHIELTFKEADERLFKLQGDRYVADVSTDMLGKSYQEIWLASSRDIPGHSFERSLRQYTEPDSPLQPLFKLREQQLQYSLNPGTVARPIDQRFVLLDETSMRVVQEIKFLTENLNAYDPLRADIQRILGSVENNVTGESSRSFLDISRQLPNFIEEFEQFNLANGREEWWAWNLIKSTFEETDKHVFVKQGNKVYANPNVRKGTSYEETWKNWVDGRSIRGYASAESPLQQAFELRQKQLDYLLENRENFLVDPSVGNSTTVRVSQEIQGLMSNLAETNPLRKFLEEKIDWSKYTAIGK